MGTLSNFSSVLEIAFSFNALLYFLEILPLQKKVQNDELEAYRKALAEKQKEGLGGILVILMERGIKEIHSFSIRTITILTLINSIISLFILILSGFEPEMKISWHWIVIVLIWLYIPTPIAYFFSLKFVKPVEISILDEFIDKAKANQNKNIRTDELTK